MKALSGPGPLGALAALFALGVPPAALEELVRNVRALDRDAVRAKVQAAEKKRPAGASPKV